MWAGPTKIHHFKHLLGEMTERRSNSTTFWQIAALQTQFATRPVEIVFVAMELQRSVQGSKTNMTVGHSFNSNDFIDQVNPQVFTAELQAEKVDDFRCLRGFSCNWGIFEPFQVRPGVCCRQCLCVFSKHRLMTAVGHFGLEQH